VLAPITKRASGEVEVELHAAGDTRGITPEQTEVMLTTREIDWQRDSGR
jgi:hypothetical protein